jgi:hypothetical protein
MHCLDNTYMSYLRGKSIYARRRILFGAPNHAFSVLVYKLVADASSGFMRQLLYPGLTGKPSAPALYIPRLALNMYRWHHGYNCMKHALTPIILTRSGPRRSLYAVHGVYLKHIVGSCSMYYRPLECTWIVMDRKIRRGPSLGVGCSIRPSRSCDQTTLKHTVVTTSSHTGLSLLGIDQRIRRSHRQSHAENKKEAMSGVNRS